MIPDPRHFPSGLGSTGPVRGRTGPHACPHDPCVGRFTSQGRLKRHLRRVHSGSGRVFCAYEACGKSFVSAAVLRIHHYCHTGERPFVCPFEGCGKGFKNPGTLNAHKFVHDRNSAFVCLYGGCGKTFRSRHTLKVHEYVHRDYRPCVCPFEGCTSRFRTRIDLARHRRVHTGEKPFLCVFPGCRKAFSLRGNLVQHQLIHSSTASFPCPHESCQGLFRSRKSLKRHMAVHLAAQLFPWRLEKSGTACTPPSATRAQGPGSGACKPYACPVEGCVRRFARRDDLSWHRYTHARHNPFLRSPVRSMVDCPVLPLAPARPVTCPPGRTSVKRAVNLTAAPSRLRQQNPDVRPYGVEAVFRPNSGRRAPGTRTARPGVRYVSVIVG